MIRKIKRTIIAISLSSTVTAAGIFYIQKDNEEDIVTDKSFSPIIETNYVDEEAVFEALEETPQIIGLTGDIEKNVKFNDKKWFGNKEYAIKLNGEFKLGIDTEDISIITHENTVIVKYPHSKIISVSLPFDYAEIDKDVGLLRKSLNEKELQSLYGEAREDAINDIKINIKARDKSDKYVENALEGLIKQVKYVDDVKFINKE